MGAYRQSRQADGVALWKCCSCGEFLPRERFTTDNRNAGGVHSRCRGCSVRLRDNKKHRDRNREAMRTMYSRDPEKYRGKAAAERMAPATAPKVAARKRVSGAIRSGKLKRPDRCSRCGGTERIQAHHPDHAKPLDVVWLCSVCHGQE